MPIWLLYALISSGPRTFETLLRGPRLGDSFHLSPVQGYRRENHGDRRPDDGFKGGSIGFVFLLLLLLCFFFFQSQYLPSLNTSCLATNKDMEKRLPQLYYTKMKNCCNQCYMLTSAPVSLNIGFANKLKHLINELKTYLLARGYNNNFLEKRFLRAANICRTHVTD